MTILGDIIDLLSSQLKIKNNIIKWLTLIIIGGLIFIEISIFCHSRWELDRFGWYKQIPNDADTMPSTNTMIKDIVITNTIGIRLKLIRSGTFFMGSMDNSSEYPVRKVIISKPFFISIYETTQHEWDAIIKKDTLETNDSNLPVVNVSLTKIQNFIQLLSLKEKKKYRLPTEAEWEYVCRAGSTTKYFFGTNNNILKEYAWYKENSLNMRHSVGTKKPNNWGIYDMYGNVNELCLDNWGNYSIEDLIDPIGKGVKIINNHVCRGGDWISGVDKISSSCRMTTTQTKDNALGFRIIMIPDITDNY